MRRAWLAAGFIGLFAGPASAFECKRSSTHPWVSLTWPDRRVAFGVAPAPGIDLAAVRGALSAWAQVGCSDAEPTLLGVVPASALPAASISFIDQGWERDGRSVDALALTTTTYNRSTGSIFDSRIEVNRERFRFEPSTRCDPDTEPAYDLQAVLAHEVGHALGLAHPEVWFADERDPTMAPSLGPCETDKRQLKPDDEAGLCALYPRGEANGGCDVLPARSRPVHNRALGCTAGPAASPPWFAVLLLVTVAWRWPCSRGGSAR